MYEVVADIEKYKDFLPWCKSSEILERDGNELKAELAIGFQMFEEKYVSKVVLDEPKSVKVFYLPILSIYHNKLKIIHLCKIIIISLLQDYY